MAWVLFEENSSFGASKYYSTAPTATISKLAQTFTPQVNHYIAEVSLRLYRVGTPGIINWYIYATDISGFPTGPILASGSGNANGITDSDVGAWTVLELSGVNLTSGTLYAIVLTAPNAPSGSSIKWRHSTGTNDYANGTELRYNTSTGWEPHPTYDDFLFKCYGIGQPGKATNPSPSDTASDITLDETFSWDASADYVADTYEIYFREQGDDWELVGVAQAGVAYDLSFGSLDYNTTYEWRIDATNSFGTVTGDTWSFDTIVFKPVLAGASGGAGGGGGGGGSGEESSPNGENNMITLRRLVAAAANKIWYEDI